MDSSFNDLRLRWPAALVLGVLARSVHSARDSLALEHLLWESCLNSAGRRLSASDGFPPPVLASLWSRNVFDEEDVSRERELDFDRFVHTFRRALSQDAIPAYVQPQYYRSRARGTLARPEALQGKAMVRELLNVLGELDHDGYFDDAFGSSCCDARIDRQQAARDQITERLGVVASWAWPPGPNDYDSALVDIPLEHKGDLVLGHAFDLLEVCHDLVARPSRRSWHDYGEEWDYLDFDRPAGQLVYRWRINAVLDRSDLHLRIAGAGLDTGRLVQTPGDPRSELGEHALAATPPEHVERVSHAITKFRGREATREDKRDAIKALGDVLEHQRPEVRKILGKKDEGALFNILNEYDIRHHNSAQYSEYDEDFLDWIFWTLLASLDFMSNRLARNEDATAP